MALQKQLDIELKVKQGAENMIQMYSNGSSKVSIVNELSMYSLSWLFADPYFHICEFEYLLKFTCNPNIHAVGTSAAVEVDMHRGEKFELSDTCS